MSAVMEDEITLFSEALPTNMAYVGLFTSMDTSVKFQMFLT